MTALKAKFPAATAHLDDARDYILQNDEWTEARRYMARKYSLTVLSSERREKHPRLT